MRRRNRGVPRAFAPSLSRQAPTVEALERAVEDVRKVAEAAAGSALARAGRPFDQDLINGTTHIPHGLGRPVQMILWIPKAANAPAPGFDPDQPGNPHPKREVWITCTAAGQYRLVLL